MPADSEPLPGPQTQVGLAPVPGRHLAHQGLGLAERAQGFGKSGESSLPADVSKVWNLPTQATR